MNWLEVQSGVTERVNEGLETLHTVEAFTRHRIARKFALYSGGNDSICSTHLAMLNGWADEVIHIDTGIGIGETHVVRGRDEKTETQNY